MRRRTVRLTALAISMVAMVAASAAFAAPMTAPPIPAAPALPLVDGDSSADALPAAADPATAQDPTIAGGGLADIGEDVEIPRILESARRISCVPFARALSGIDIRGNASTWWEKAKGFYARFTTPEAGTVMVFAPKRGMRAGHVAVVKEIVSDREILIDHANWGRDGKIYINAPVVDVSPNNDWSQVRVWNVKLGVMGSHTYRISGFVGT